MYLLRFKETDYTQDVIYKDIENQTHTFFDKFEQLRSLGWVFGEIEGHDGFCQIDYEGFLWFRKDDFGENFCIKLEGQSPSKMKVLELATEVFVEIQNYWIHFNILSEEVNRYKICGIKDESNRDFFVERAEARYKHCAINARDYLDTYFLDSIQLNFCYFNTHDLLLQLQNDGWELEVKDKKMSFHGNGCIVFPFLDKNDNMNIGFTACEGTTFYFSYRDYHLFMIFFAENKSKGFLKID